MNISITLKTALISAALVFLSGCGSLQVKSASASAKLNIGILDLEADVEIERRPKEESRGYGGLVGPSLAALASGTRIELTAVNASIPNQSTLAVVSIRDSHGSLVAARTFVANVTSGTGVFNDPAQVEAWFNSTSIPETARISVAAPGLEIDPPSAGSYQAISKVVVGNQVVASATASGYVGPGRGDRPPTRPQ